MVESNGTWGCEYRFYNSKDNTTTWVYGLLREVRDHTNNLYGYVGVNVDITRRKKAETQANKEAQLRDQQERILIEQSKLADLGSMMRVVYHQWKQPLHVIYTLAELLPEYLEETSDKAKEVRKDCEMIHEQIHFMISAIDDFRNFFKPTSEKKEFSPLDAMKEVNEMFKDVFVYGKCHIVIQNEKTPSLTYGYRSEFMQAILNLFNNAMEAMHEKDITDGMIICTSSLQNERFIISIKDNAGGIREDLLPERIFELNLTTKGDQGSGIGLYISKSIIEDHMDGKLFARNADNGAEFIIDIPYISRKLS